MSANQRGWCSRRDCPCWRPGTKACSQWEGYDKGRGNGPYRKNDRDSWPVKFCPCCGFEKKDHKPLIHKGRKSRV